MTEVEKLDSYLTFRLGDEVFAASVSKVIEILEIPKITRSPHFMRGVVNLRGSVLPVIDSRIKFGLPPAPDTVNTCIIVMNINMEGQDMVLGAIADNVQEVMEIEQDRIQPAPSMGAKYKSEFIEGMVKVEDQFIMLLDLDLVFSSEEVNLLQALSEVKDTVIEK